MPLRGIIASALKKITAPVEVDPYWDNVVFLLRGEDFTDSSKYDRTVTYAHDATISNTVVKFGSGSTELDGNDDYVQIDNDDVDFGLDDLTIEDLEEVEKVIEEAEQIVEDKLPPGLPEAALPRLPSSP